MEDDVSFVYPRNLFEADEPFTQRSGLMAPVTLTYPLGGSRYYKSRKLDLMLVYQEA